MRRRPEDRRVNDILCNVIVQKLGLSGFYYVKTESGVIYECRAKGTFKNQDITPLVGDNVVFQVTDADERTGFVTEIAYRKNQLIRPAVANVDQAMVVFAVRSPNPNLSILDRFLVLMQKQNIPVIIVFNKKDLAKADDIKNLKDTYKNSGCRLVFISAGGDKPKGLMQLKMMLRNKITVMAGPSGVGKSTLINAIAGLKEGEDIATVGSLSAKAGRGKQTTRHNELFDIGNSFHIIDTPGFTSLLVNEDDYTREELQEAFPEFLPYKSKCPFKDCKHIKERDCAVREAAEAGKISISRYNSYKAIFQEIKTRY